ncbi:PQQ-binding-like beta-propeller repeat protein [Haloplanus pelagicus]|uniref:PQQ-binding-like beta-propeller repeat protein n=1 Tax=Haloplanus pelagicus TaxID=2949995 RepID=UPI00203BCAB4|nr:PQQ-binding-like beta-propeller repeat protein [Haloplanus sp. HW8-1]
MERDTFTRRKCLAAIAGGLTAGCGGRAAEESSTPTSPTATATARPIQTGAADPTAEAAATLGAAFDRGVGRCALEASPTPDGTWPMINRDPAGTNASPASNGPTEFPLNERWTMSALEAQVTFPVADDGFVYLVAADPDSDPSVPMSAVLCHDPRRNGEIQWRRRVDAMPVGPPVADGETVYVAFGSPEDARVQAIDRTDGSLRNVYDLPGRFVGELATAGTSLVMPTEDAYRVVDARTGAHCWSFAPNDLRGSEPRNRKIRDAAVGDGAAFVGTGYPDSQPTTGVGHLYAVDPSVPGMRWHVPMDGPVGRIAVTDDAVIVTTDDSVAGFDLRSGEKRWTDSVERSVRPATLAVADGVAVYGTRRTLHGLDVATGTERWAVPFGVRGDVIFVGDVLYAVGRRDPTSRRILLVAVDVASGTPRWQQELYDPIVDVMAANGYLYAVTTDGRLFAFSSV